MNTIIETKKELNKNASRKIMQNQICIASEKQAEKNSMDTICTQLKNDLEWYANPLEKNKSQLYSADNRYKIFELISNIN